MPAIKIGQTPKFALKWHGPFLIKEKIDDLRYVVSLKDDNSKVVHHDRLKLYRENVQRCDSDENVIHNDTGNIRKTSNIKDNAATQNLTEPLDTLDNMVRTDDPEVTGRQRTRGRPRYLEDYDIN